MNISEPQAFAERLRRALAGMAVRPSPTLVAHEFNQRYRGRNVTTHTVRNWLLGQAIPTQDKLRVLAEWLQVSPDELRFGYTDTATAPLAPELALEMADHEMVRRYIGLPLEARKTVREVVMALSTACQQKGQSLANAYRG